MTLPASGTISLANVNTEVGASAGTTRALSWVQSNTYYAYTNLNALHGLMWFTAVSSQNSVNRTAGSTTTNCTSNCTSYDANCHACTTCECGPVAWTAPNYAVPNQSVNCNQCGYSHGTYLQGNCNCNCNCANCVCSSNDCNCDCGCSCFPAGTRVMLSSGIEIPIEQLTVGMQLLGGNGSVNTIVGMAYPVLAHRGLMSMADGSLLWSDEHPLFVRREAGQGWWVANYENWLAEVAGGKIAGLTDNSSIYQWQGGGEEFATLYGWRRQLPVRVFGGLARPDLQLYFVQVDGDRTFFANGYRVAGGAGDFTFPCNPQAQITC